VQEIQVTLAVLLVQILEAAVVQVRNQDLVKVVQVEEVLLS
jgi:hypothetical protein